MAINIPSGALMPALTRMGTVSLTVGDLDRSIMFYQRILGLCLLRRTDQMAVLGTEIETALLLLIQQDGTLPPPPFATGLYHVAILLPSRADLAVALLRLVEENCPLDGVADHLVSEAIYLSDPDGNGLEIYRDRPREVWRWQDGRVKMSSDPLDVRALLAEGQQQRKLHSGKIPDGTVIGHVHLRVGDLDQAEQFYHGLLGFALTQRISGALFVSAGGYHHHLGLNTWQSHGAPRAPKECAGLRFLTIEVPNQHELTKLHARLAIGEWPFERYEQDIVTHDPWGNTLVFTCNAITVERLEREGLLKDLR